RERRRGEVRHAQAQQPGQHGQLHGEADGAHTIEAHESHSERKARSAVEPAQTDVGQRLSLAVLLICIISVTIMRVWRTPRSSPTGSTSSWRSPRANVTASRSRETRSR